MFKVDKISHPLMFNIYSMINVVLCLTIPWEILKITAYPKMSNTSKQIIISSNCYRRMEFSLSIYIYIVSCNVKSLNIWAFFWYHRIISNVKSSVELKNCCSVEQCCTLPLVRPSCFVNWMHQFSRLSVISNLWLYIQQTLALSHIHV